MTKKQSPAVRGPDFVALQVSDLEASRRFWVEKVGLVAVPTDGNFGRQFTFADPDGYTVVAHDGK